MFDNTHLGCSNLGIVRRRQFLVMDVGNDLITKGEECISVGIFIFMNMDRRDFKRIVPLRADFFIGDAFVIFLDMSHQHMEMQ